MGESRMTSNSARIHTVEGKSPVEVRRKLPKYWVFGELACLGAFLRGTLAILASRCLEMEALILILLTMLRAGVPNYAVKWEISAGGKMNDRTRRTFVAGLLIITGTIGLVQAGPVEDLLAGDFDWTTDTVILKPDPSKMPPTTPEWSQVKDPSIVYYRNRWHLFCSILREVPENVSGRLRVGYMSFSNWKDAQSTQWQFINLYNPDDFMGYHGAPQVFYFAPQNKWYLVYQLADKSRGLSYGPYYSTTADIADPTSWAMPQLLHATIPGNEGLDHWVICDDSYAYHFWTTLNGNMWMARTRLSTFPKSGWTAPVIAKHNANLFEAGHTYRIKGLDKYLTIAVNGESPRFYQAYILRINLPVPGRILPQLRTDLLPALAM